MIRRHFGRPDDSFFLVHAAITAHRVRPHEHSKEMAPQSRIGKTMPDNPNSRDLSRRTLVKGAAWSVPVVAVAVATPLAAASETPPAATFWATGATVSVVSGNVTNFTVEGSDANGNLALLPAGTSVMIVPDAGVTLQVVNAIGIVVTTNPDGSITGVITASDITNVRIQFRPTGPSGSGYAITTNIDIDPFTETIDVTLR